MVVVVIVNLTFLACTLCLSILISCVPFFFFVLVALPVSVDVRMYVRCTCMSYLPGIVTGKAEFTR